ncbi:HEWD family protein [Halosegnis rubeus]|mgnify:CR=1 FL=1|jgi:hypothetical protein|uniref:HEWD family protein n=1 Tax=Halosegnis rubeus TaxID=2212850 RepID=UPI0015627C22|nr:HEWD family protein [Halosegnis rubeus]
MGIELVPPTERVCERCGRRDEWDNETENWVIVGKSGSATCIHEWDINGTHDPINETA